jgi:ABC-2 type transport system ATP-binding protein
VADAVFSSIAGVSDVVVDGHVVRMRVAGPIGGVLAAAAPHGIIDVVSREPNLEDVFLAQYGAHDGR